MAKSIFKIERIEKIENIGTCVRKDHGTFARIMTYSVFVELFIWAGEGIRFEFDHAYKHLLNIDHAHTTTRSSSMT